ncbi:MAG: DUF1002 domain-containing protein [Dorea sp.]|nr:DUF1002 domain-containing protein [Dorea sp.]MCI9248774.1 DUF1002 domain-containing protein [Dorea sp.]
MKKFQSKALCLITAAALVCSCLPMTAKADSSKVVTLGTNLSDEQKKSMYEYFGTTADEVETIEVTNQDERKYMEGIASEAQIGKKTFSCSYVEPTQDGGIQVKVANLTFVTSSMIASTLLTSGVENCNVVAASPIEVSGTGALTGIMMAYESASGEELSEEQKAAATEELVTTGELADDVGQDAASNLMNDVKQEVIEQNLTDEDKIKNTVEDAADKHNVTLTDEQIAKITALMQNIAQYDYDVKALKETLDNLEGKEEGFFSKLISSITGLFGGGDDKGGIINSTNDSILGDNAVIDSTLDDIKDKVSSDENEGFFDKIVNFFKDLFGGSETDDAEDADLEPAEPQSTDDGSLPEDDPEDPENPNNISGQKAGEESGEDGGLEEDIPEDGQADEEDVSDGSDVSE